MCGNGSYLFETFNSHCVTSEDLAINICIAIAAVFIVVINVMALVTLRSCSDMEDPSNYFITNLAAADALTGIFVLYDTVYNVLQFKNYIECVVRVGFFAAVNLASVLNLTTLTLDRYVKITCPFAYLRHVSFVKVKVIEGVLWSLSIIVGSLPFFGWSSMDISKVCSVFGIMTSSYQLFLISLFAVPFVVIIYAYVKLVIIAREHTREITSLQAPNVRGRNILKTWRSVKTAFIIVGAYFICWMPVGLFTLLVLLTNIRASLPTSPNVVFTYLLGLGVLNSVLNPIIYATKIPVFRKRLRAVFCVSRVEHIHQMSVRSAASLFRMEPSSPRRQTATSLNDDIS
ncbi:cannabinoid receptor 1-like [Haliotis rufescens]|uniref:cannabinoid receptor 1-like n=1 Tax=Haliotis rufescens TaxID=6454 RepID=UPI00201F4E7E|nr:cannabinoid receptor 1-like [Haliotis rufescens]